MDERASNRHFERASKISHSHIINDKQVREYLNNCQIPVDAQDVALDPTLLHSIDYPKENSIEFIVACNGERTTVPVKKTFPSSLVTFFQFGSLLIKISDLEGLKSQAFVSPSDIRKLKSIKREKFVLPTKNISLKAGDDLETSARNAIQDFFGKEHSGKKPMLDTLRWFLFELYDPDSDKKTYTLSKCPHCGTNNIELENSQIDLSTHSWGCPNCKRRILITDVFRLFEKVDNENGAEGILTYLTNVIETFLMIHTIKNLLEIEDGLVDRFLFVKDGPLSFGGETANMHKPMQTLISYLADENKINMVGVESSGPFVDHAKEIKNKLNPGQVLLLNNEHIYSYILPGSPDTSTYASSSYYSGKFIYKALDSRIYVLTVPVENHNLYYSRPELDDLLNLPEMLQNIDKLKCDVYESALIPIAIANKLISLSNHPSTNILERFAKNSMNRK